MIMLQIYMYLYPIKLHDNKTLLEAFLGGMTAPNFNAEWPRTLVTIMATESSHGLKMGKCLWTALRPHFQS